MKLFKKKLSVVPIFEDEVAMESDESKKTKRQCQRHDITHHHIEIHIEAPAKGSFKACGHC